MNLMNLDNVDVRDTECSICKGRIVRYVHPTVTPYPDPLRCSECMADIVDKRMRKELRSERRNAARLARIARRADIDAAVIAMRQ